MIRELPTPTLLLSRFAIGALVAVLCLPFVLTAVPPLVDAPGHIAAAVIEAAPSASPLHQFFDWQWRLNFNGGVELLMKLLGGTLAAGWWATVITTATFLSGALLTIRTLNREGAYALGLALPFALGFPWLWGFLNFIFACGLALLAFVLADRMRQGAARAIFLIVAQMVAMLCHAVGGLLLPILVASAALGALLDQPSPTLSGRAIERCTELLGAMVRGCWPLAATAVVTVVWKLSSGATGHADLIWDWHDKLSFAKEILRDQNRWLDYVTELLGLSLLVTGGLLGARWSWRQALPVLFVLTVYICLPARIGGSQAVDTRMLPIVFLLGLGLQDWSWAKPSIRMTVLALGVGILTARWCLMMVGFAHYAGEYSRQFAGLDPVAAGSRVYVLRGHACDESQWRLSRLDTLPALVAAQKGLWINTHWADPGLDMLSFRYRPEKPGQKGPQSMVWPANCLKGDRATLAMSLPLVPYAGIDYLWLMDTGDIGALHPGLTQIWRSGRSHLYRVSH